MNVGGGGGGGLRITSDASRLAQVPESLVGHWLFIGPSLHSINRKTSCDLMRGANQLERAYGAVQ